MSTVEVFADVLCPFTHGGLHTLIDRRTGRGLTQPRLRIRARPLELINGRPLDPQHIAAEVWAPRESVRPEATAAAVDADWDEGRRRGVVGSPHFFTADGDDWFCPALAISRDDVGNFIVAWKEGSTAFVDRALA